MIESLRIVRTDSNDIDFGTLVEMLDHDLSARDGDEHSFYAKYNKVHSVLKTVVSYFDGVPTGCGAIREYSSDTAEVKRMYVRPEQRGIGIAGKILNELESMAIESGYSICILETGKKQPEAIRLYEKSGYSIIPNYDQYIGIENSVCMKKHLK